jgi:hypothetical protein
VLSVARNPSSILPLLGPAQINSAPRFAVPCALCPSGPVCHFNRFFLTDLPPSFTSLMPAAWSDSFRAHLTLSRWWCSWVYRTDVRKR